MIDEDERAKAAFISGYRDLCAKHRMMVIQRYRKRGYSPHMVLKFDNPTVLDQQCEEMRIERLGEYTGEYE